MGPFAHSEGALEKRTSLTIVPKDHPEFLQCCAQAHADLPALCRLFVYHLFQRPLQGFAQIVVLVLQSSYPHGLVGTVKFRLGLFGQRQEVAGMRHAGPFQLSARSQPLQPKLAHGLQHQEAWLLGSLFARLDEAVIQECREAVQHIQVSLASVLTECLGSRKRPAVHKDREQVKERLLLWS